jgi:hypothetical protein
VLSSNHLTRGERRQSPLTDVSAYKCCDLHEWPQWRAASQHRKVVMKVS